MRALVVSGLVAIAACQEPIGQRDAGGDPDAGAPADPPRTWTIHVFEPPAGDAYMEPLRLAKDGAIVGYAGAEAWDPGARPARLIVDRAATVLEAPERNFGFAFGGANGATVGEWHWSPQHWKDGTRTTLPVVDGWFSGSAKDMNSAGLIVGSFADYDDPLGSPTGPRPCAWPSHTEVVALRGPTGDALGTAWAVSEGGIIAGTVQTVAAMQAARWDAIDANPTLLGGPEGALASEGRGINEAGDVAGRSVFTDGRSVATIFPAEGDPRELPYPVAGHEFSEALAIDGAQRAVGIARVDEGVTHGILWENDQPIDLNARIVDPPAGFDHIAAAVGIDDDGRIAVLLVLRDGERTRRTAGLLVPAE